MTELLPTLVVVFLVALAVSMTLVPVMIRLAPYIGMIDKPDQRKVHKQPIPRAGGVGIVIGSLVPMMIVLPFTDTLMAYYAGSLVLLVFGVWDDIAELGHYVKFVGQFLAAILVVYYGGVVVESFPFMELNQLSPEIGKPFTVVAIVGMINAINHSDGLDGLAGGESLMSLAGILYLASQASGFETMVLCVAVMGGVFGFLRFNSHPARVFMGDGGSQFLGFSLGMLVVLLTQSDNPALSPALPLLLLGLPIADILMVFWKRVRSGGNWFRATKNHIHHRLLELGFHHFESVTIIYTVQAVLVFSAVSLPYASDVALATIYLGVCITLFIWLNRSKAAGWSVHTAANPGFIMRYVSGWQAHANFEILAGWVVTVLVSFYLLVGAFGASKIPMDLALVAAILTVLLAIRLFLGYRVWFLMLRLLVFTSVALIVYLASSYTQSGPLMLYWAELLFFGVLGLALIFAIRMEKQNRFDVTPLDYLVLLIALALTLTPEASLQDSVLIEMAIHAIMLFYGAELALRQMRSRWNPFTGAIMVSLGVVTVRGILF